ncbi:MAG: hypothetical protein IH626_22525 [Rhodospirillales bacterium]|nr:hypothetical protein [Rhodospirillales bacterium]
MITVAATYIHIARHIYEEPDFRAKRATFERGLVVSARALYGPNININFSLDEGGTFLNVLVGAAALATIFSQGPDALDNAIKCGETALEFGNQVIQQVYESFEVSAQDIVWKQRRMGDAKRIVSIAENAKKIRQKNLPQWEVAQAKDAIQRDLFHLANKASSTPEASVAQILSPLFEELSRDILPPSPNEPEPTSSPIAALPPRTRESEEDAFPNCEYLPELVPSPPEDISIARRERAPARAIPPVRWERKSAAGFGPGPSRAPLRKAVRRRIYETTLTT